MSAKPKMGRPSISGLGIKELGRPEYNRLMAERKRRRLGIKPRNFTGLSPKRDGWSAYSRAYRQLRGKNKTGRIFLQPSKSRGATEL